jgi:hypothetical protein
MQPDKVALEELIAVYCKAWSEPNRALRQRLLDRVWAEDGTYTDPTAQVAGRRELVEHIVKFRSSPESVRAPVWMRVLK